MARGNRSIFEKRIAPTLIDFLKKQFQPFTETRFAPKPKTLDYCLFGADMLYKSDLVNLRLDEITDQHAGRFASKYFNLSPSTANCAYIVVPFRWRSNGVRLSGCRKSAWRRVERRRERVLTDDEASRYLGACPHPWKDAATLILGTGLRPGEVFKLRWDFVLLNGHGGLIQVSEGKKLAELLQVDITAGGRSRRSDPGQHCLSRRLRAAMRQRLRR